MSTFIAGGPDKMKTHKIRSLNNVSSNKEKMLICLLTIIETVTNIFLFGIKYLNNNFKLLTGLPILPKNEKQKIALWREHPREQINLNKDLAHATSSENVFLCFSITSTILGLKWII